jgi:hypothetical protein
MQVGQKPPFKNEFPNVVALTPGSMLKSAEELLENSNTWTRSLEI